MEAFAIGSKASLNSSMSLASSLIDQMKDSEFPTSGNTSINGASAMSYGYGPSDWMSIKWSGQNNPNCYPIFSPCINDPEDPFDERFGNQPVWSPPFAGNQFSNSVESPLSAPIYTTAVNWNTSRIPRALSVYTEPDMKPVNNDISQFIEEREEGGGCDPMTDEYQTSPESLSPTSRNNYKPAWKSPLDAHNLEISASPRATKKQKHTYPALAHPKTHHRRSQRKAPLSIKSPHSYIDISTSPSSPEVSYPQTPESKTKKSHNLTEKKYRNRLNGYFDNLLSAIPKHTAVQNEGKVTGEEKKVSKGEVLILALEHIHALEKEVEGLRREKTELGDEVEKLMEPKVEGKWEDMKP